MANVIYNYLHPSEELSESRVNGGILKTIRPPLDDKREKPDKVDNLHHHFLMIPMQTDSEDGADDIEHKKTEEDLHDALEGLEADEEEARLVDLSTLSIPALLPHPLDGSVDVQSG